MKNDFPNGLLNAHASMPDSDAILTRFQELIRQGGIAANEPTDDANEWSETPATEPLEAEAPASETEESETQRDEVSGDEYPEEEHDCSSEQAIADGDEPSDHKPVEADDS